MSVPPPNWMNPPSPDIDPASSGLILSAPDSELGRTIPFPSATMNIGPNRNAMCGVSVIMSIRIMIVPPVAIIPPSTIILSIPSLVDRIPATKFPMIYPRASSAKYSESSAGEVILVILKAMNGDPPRNAK